MSNANGQKKKKKSAAVGTTTERSCSSSLPWKVRGPWEGKEMVLWFASLYCFLAPKSCYPFTQDLSPSSFPHLPPHSSPVTCLCLVIIPVGSTLAALLLMIPPSGAFSVEPFLPLPEPREVGSSAHSAMYFFSCLRTVL